LFRSPHLESAAIREAHPRIHPVFRDTPQYVHQGLSAGAGVPVIVKIETVNPIRSFKGRGTWIALSALEGEGRITRDRPVVCASAGNFGQGVAYAARALGITVEGAAAVAWAGLLAGPVLDGPALLIITGSNV